MEVVIMKEYDYKKEYKKLLDNYNELKSKSNIIVKNQNYHKNFSTHFS